MKDSVTYSKEIRKLFRELKKKNPKVPKPDYDDPLEALVYAIISENADLSSSKKIAKKIKAHFVDLNDLRVSRTEEILDVLDSTSADTKKTANALRQALNAVFNKYDIVNLEALTETGKRQAKKVLEKFEGISIFAVDYCFMAALGGHAIPLTAKMLSYLRESELVHPESTDEEIAGFLERQISSSDGYRFYTLLRQETERGSKRAAKKAAAKTKKKSTKKKATKKRTKKK
jgi:hypothetical protein